MVVWLSDWLGFTFAVCQITSGQSPSIGKKEKKAMLNDWNDVRYNLDVSSNFTEIYNSPYYTDAVYDKFSEAEYQRRYSLAREKMKREGVDALLLTGGSNNWSCGAGVNWASGLLDKRGISQYVVLPLEGDTTLIY